MHAVVNRRRILDTGRYTITNVKFGNVITLPGEAGYTEIVSAFGDGDSDEQWNVVLLSNKNYTIRNYGHATYCANREPCPQPGATIFGGDKPQQWRIREMTTKGQYIIFPTDTRIYWGLADSESGSPITLSEGPYDTENQWIFTRVSETDSPLFTPPFFIPTDSVPDTVRHLNSETSADTSIHHPHPLVANHTHARPNFPRLASERPDLTESIKPLKTFPSARGGFADVWEATLGDLKVAVKVLRPPLENDEEKEKLEKRLRRELRVWSGLSHKNVLPFMGVTTSFGPYLSMVCPWMGNGTLNAYLDRSVLILSDKFRLLSQIAEGLSYLHSRGVIHGDLTGSNVLIDDNGVAFLGDFGLSTILAEFQGTSYFTSNIRGAIRYAAPEIYAPPKLANSSSICVSSYSDVYSFGSIMLQTISGRIPYHDVRNDIGVIFELYNGRTPPRPSEPWFTDNYWEFIARCWDKDPLRRPVMQEVLSFMQACQDELQSSSLLSMIGSDPGQKTKQFGSIQDLDDLFDLF